ncbi:MAG: nicotinate phosphoribosyltransferase [Chloroflexi bacterium]|nr:nicotinate phosphoribosyltransferase [Chloroflexota bacterium]
MTVLDHRRLTQATLRLDIDGLRRGLYSDKYFDNVTAVLTAAQQAGYTFAGSSPRDLPGDPAQVAIGDLVVEVQVFTRRKPYALIAGVDAALAMIRHATGCYDADGHFTETWDQLEVEAVEDGVFAAYDGDPLQVRPVIKIRGRYRDFALLETPILGVLTRASRVATNVYQVLEVANGKPVLFFPARFDLPEVQAIDGYAYWLAIQRINADKNASMTAAVSTDAQASWWGGRGGGTIPHALIAAFLADTAESMVAFARFRPVSIPRIALVDFNNDAAGDSLKTLAAFWPLYRAAYESGDEEGQRRWTLNGVRIDTSASVRDVSLGEGDPYGINPKLVRLVRDRIDTAWQSWDVPEPLHEIAEKYCRNVQIVVTGGFNRERIAQYEAEGVPVDVYGVGSSLLRNDSATGTDFTMDVVRVQINGQWVDMAKVGRQPNTNPDLQPVDLSQL